jgi:hypothetical protein
MGLISRIKALEESAPQPSRSQFVLAIPPSSVQSREQHEAWSNQHHLECSRAGVPVFTLEVPWTRNDKAESNEDHENE